MSASSFIFYFLELVAAVCAVALIFARQVFHGALLVITILVALAGMYVFAFAEFVAVSQLLVYAAGILVVIIIAIMLTNRSFGKSFLVTNGNQIAGSLLCGSLLIVLVYVAVIEDFSPNSITGPASMQKIGIELMTTYALPFEISGIVLLVSLIAATVISSTDQPKKS
jgi:NADH:ubiquinone oxidoreductase subunit 6 (subunit J)